MAPTAGMDRSFIEAASEAMRSLYDAIENREIGRLQEVLAPDVLALTPESGGVLTSASEAQAELVDRLDASPEAQIHLQSTDLRVGTVAEGVDAWASDQVMVDRGTASPIHVRGTAAMSWDGSHCRVTAGHFSIPLSNDQTRTLVEAGRLPPGASLSNALHRDAQTLVDLLDECLSDPRRFSQVCSTRADAVAFGSAAEEVFYGPQVKQAWDEFISFGPRMERRGGVAAGVSESGELGWVSTHIDISFDITRPYRFFIIYARDNGRWEMVSIHDSVSSDIAPEQPPL